MESHRKTIYLPDSKIDDPPYRKTILNYVVQQQLSKIYKTDEVYCTGSSYTGNANVFGLTGYGTYVYPHGVIYKGDFFDGMFHGDGILYYPDGQMVKGMWKSGILVSHEFIFSDGLELEFPWRYCKMPDRRFHIECTDGFQPSPEEYRTHFQPTREIPEFCYDAGYGFYNENTQCIICVKQGEKCSNHDYETPDHCYMRHILKHCRKYGDEPIGYRKDLYEFWWDGRERTEKQNRAKYHSHY